MTQEEVAAVVGLVVALIIHTGALFYWGGSVRQMLSDHDRRIMDLERRVYPRRQA